MAPYEALYGRKCRSPLCWCEVGDKSLLGLDLVQETTSIIQIIREMMRTTQSWQNSYADKRRKPLEFQEGEHVFLRFTPKTRVGRSMKVKKLNPRFMCPFQILKRVGSVAYQLALPPQLSNLHDVFHVSQLRTYVSDKSHVIAPESVQLKDNLIFKPRPTRIIDKSTKTLRNKVIPLVNVVWEELTSAEASWELEEEVLCQYPKLVDVGT
ncbi:uncharacterized protein [Cicer arietinum]|uniref:uncharacterized protein n=1 Tax=Cicer arietinum TaxID=3827 RepID=UPI003CC54748